MKNTKHYDHWLAKLRKRAQPSGTLSQWAHQIAVATHGTPAQCRDKLQKILDGAIDAEPDLILDLDRLSAPVARPKTVDSSQLPLF